MKNSYVKTLMKLTPGCHWGERDRVKEREIEWDHVTIHAISCYTSFTFSLYLSFPLSISLSLTFSFRSSHAHNYSHLHFHLHRHHQFFHQTISLHESVSQNSVLDIFLPKKQTPNLFKLISTRQCICV